MDFTSLMPALFVALVTGAASGLVMWGGMRADLRNIGERQGELEKDVKDHETRIVRLEVKA